MQYLCVEMISPLLQGSMWVSQEPGRLGRVPLDIHGQFSPLVDEGSTFITLKTGISTSNNEAFVSLQPANLEDVKLSALWTHIGDMVRDGTRIDLSLDGCWKRHICGGLLLETDRTGNSW